MERSKEADVCLDWVLIRGPRFISYMALRMEAKEKATETIGIDGRHRRLPSSSSMQVLVTSLLQGNTSTPLSIRKPRRTTCIGDSVTPVIAFTSLALCSRMELSFERRTPRKRNVGRKGKNRRHISVNRRVEVIPKGDQPRPLW